MTIVFETCQCSEKTRKEKWTRQRGGQLYFFFRSVSRTTGVALAAVTTRESRSILFISGSASSRDIRNGHVFELRRFATFLPRCLEARSLRSPPRFGKACMQSLDVPCLAHARNVSSYKKGLRDGGVTKNRADDAIRSPRLPPRGELPEKLRQKQS